MATVSTYLDFQGRTEAAFAFYKQVFQTDYAGPIHRIKDVPPAPGVERTEEQGNRIAHMALPILGGHLLRGTDVPTLTQGNHIGIFLEPDTRAEAQRLFAALATEGRIAVPLGDQFWGAYFGQCFDAFGVMWFVNVEHSQEAP